MHYNKMTKTCGFLQSTVNVLIIRELNMSDDTLTGETYHDTPNLTKRIFKLHTQRRHLPCLQTILETKQEDLSYS